MRSDPPVRPLWVILIALAAFVAPGSANAAAEFAFPTGGGIGAGTSGIVAGPDGNLWFTERGANRIGYITPSGVMTTLSGLDPGSGPQDIAVGPDGDLWFTERDADRIGRITTDGLLDEFSTGITPGAGPYGIVAGPDGNLWFTEGGGNRIGRITPSGSVTEFSSGLVTGSPVDIAAGPDGNLWFALNGGHAIGRITPSGVITEFSAGVGLSAFPRGITAGPDGNVWYAADNSNRIGRVRPDGTITEFPIGGIFNGGTALDITTGPEGSLWFPGSVATSLDVGRASPTGAISSVLFGRPSGTEIVTGPDGKLWVTTSDGHIVRVDTEVPGPTTGNLLRNPGFEEGAAPGLSGASAAPSPGWATMPNLTAVPYGSGAGVPSAGVGAAVAGGADLAWGGPANPRSQAIQEVDVSGQASGIDAGRGTTTLSALLGGIGNDADNAMVTATFLDGDSEPLGTGEIGPVTAGDRGGQTTLLPRSLTVAVPRGTRSIRVTLVATRASGSTNNGFADNVSLVLDVAPGPPSPQSPVVAPGPPPAAPNVSISRLKATPAAFVARGASARLSKRARTTPVGTTISYRLSAPASVTVTAERLLVGRRVRGRCVATPLRAASRAPRCTVVTRIAGRLRVAGITGLNRIRFNGRLAGAALRPGNYRLTAIARTPSGRQSAAAVTKIVILPRR